MTRTSIAFIGGGNMSRAIISGLLGVDQFEIHAADPGAEARTELSKFSGIHIYENNDEAVSHAQCVVIAVKPQIMKKVCMPLSSLIRERDALVISVAAGIECQHMTNWFDGHQRVVRVMPNTPALIGAGASGMYGASGVCENDKQLAQQLFSSVGVAQWVDQERLIDAVTALSGSGPAYFFYFMEAMEATAIKLGLPQKTAQELARNTAFGAAKMALSEDRQLADLRQRVTSPGGTTAAALQSFSDNGLNDIIESAMNAAEQRAQQLAKEFGQ